MNDYGLALDRPLDVAASRKRTAVYAALCLPALAAAAALFAFAGFRLAPWPIVCAAALFGGAAMVYPVLSAVDFFLSRRAVQPVIARRAFADGIPDDCRTLVAIPTLLHSVAYVDKLAAHLERCALDNPSRNVFYGLITDFTDADGETLEDDAPLLEALRTQIDALNRRHPNLCAGFVALHRRRSWSEDQQRWMGAGRKRLKLEQLNRFLLSADDADFPLRCGPVARLRAIRYVICLDSDTRLPAGQAQAMIGAIAHPANAPVLCARSKTLLAGHAMLQPRICAAPWSGPPSWIGRMNSTLLGRYDGAVRVDDLFFLYYREACFFGKGIYDVAAVHALTEGRIVGEDVLSHDVIEGALAGCGAVPFAHLEEPAEPGVLSEMRRRHRWIRGDWQNLVWMLRDDGTRIPTLAGRLKVLDNVRRSLMPPTAFAAAVWLAFCADAPFLGFAALAAVFLLPAALIDYAGCRSIRGIRRIMAHLADSPGAARRRRLLLLLLLLPSEALVNLDAALRGLYRIGVSRRRRLDWNASDQPLSAAPGWAAHYRALRAGPIAGVALVAGQSLAHAWLGWSVHLTFAGVIGLLWIIGPGVAFALSRPGKPPTGPSQSLSTEPSS
ncbi:MAG: hypothetical protein E6Q88_08080 [Lysobacteraceae bacterium]|nr:MAG: hypothetical protein E6Q88_08080 [Xanthomonadaceae bacterium]